MNVVGFDVSKAKLDGARVDRSGQIKERFEIANTHEALLPVLARLRAKYKHLEVASESTGDYHRTLALACIEVGIPFKLLNALTVKQYIRRDIRKRKTDKTDAEAIARVAQQEHGQLQMAASLGITKPMFRTSASLTELRISLVLMEQRLTPLLPEHPELLESLRGCQVQLANASKTFRLAAGKACDPALIQLLRTIPGIGELTAPAIVAELGDITRFRGPKQLVAFAGLDPRIKQSGSSLNRYGHITKRGAPHLRRMFYIAATVARRHDPVCKALHEKKRAEGKRFKEAIMVVARKLLRIVYRVWMSGKAYEIRPMSGK